MTFAGAQLVERAKFLAAIGLSERQLDDALHAKRLFVVRMGGHEYVPRFFLDERYVKRQLHALCKLLGDLPSGSKLQFFVTPKASLSGRTPLEALLERKATAVRRTAEAFVVR